MASTKNNIQIRNHPTEENGYIIPKHYVAGKYQLIDIMEDQLSKEGFQGWAKGLILKYTARVDADNKLRSLTKAKYYLDELINFLSTTDEVSEEHVKPAYYKNQNIETIDIIEDQLTPNELEGFYQGMVIRYICRSTYKNHNLDDFIKAKYYLDRLINKLKGEQDKK